jgi:hypothetical protein
MNPLRVSTSLRPLVVIVMMVFVPSQGAVGLQVSPPSGNRGAPAPRNCEAAHAKRIADAKTAFDGTLRGINRRFMTKLNACQNSFSSVDSPACLQTYSDTMKSLSLQTMGATSTCYAVCALAVVPPAVMAPPCASCIGLVTAAVMGQAANAAYTRTKCLDEAMNKATLCSNTAADEASDEVEDALDALRIEIAKAERDYRDCKANAGG